MDCWWLFGRRSRQLNNFLPVASIAYVASPAKNFSENI